MPGKLKLWAVNTGVMLFSLALFAIGAELSVRGLQAINILPVLTADSISIDGPALQKNNARLIKSPNATLALEYDKKDPAINSLGMRDREYSLQDHSDSIRIAAIGDSVTFGLGVALEDTYPKQLQTSLNQQAGADAFTVMNFGVSGYSSESELEWFKIAAQPFHPSLVVVGYVMNDPIETNKLFGAVAEAMKHAREFGRIADKSQVLAWIYLNWDRATTAIKALDTYTPYYQPEGERWNSVVDAMREFKQLSQQEHFELVVLVFPMLYQFEDYPFQQYHEQVIELLEAEGIRYIDLLPVYRAQGYEKLRILENDATHPNELGHKLAAESLETYIAEHGLLESNTLHTP